MTMEVVRNIVETGNEHVVEIGAEYGECLSEDERFSSLFSFIAMKELTLSNKFLPELDACGE